MDSEITKLLGEYTGTLSDDDVARLRKLRKYEDDFDFARLNPLIWGPTSVAKYADLKLLGATLWNRPSTDDVVELIDAKLMFKSSLRLPLQLKFDVEQEEDFTSSKSNEYSNVYDPRFFLSVFCSLFRSQNVVNCRNFARKNCLSLCFSCLSCHDVTLRQLAYVALGRFREYLALHSTNFEEKPQLVSLLTIFRNSLETPNRRLSSLITMFLGRAVFLIFTPKDPMYPLVSSFLLLKPAMDLENVPEFYKFFHSSSAEFVYERNWVLTLIADGLRENKDYRILEKRYVFKLLLTFFNCSLCDVRSRHLISNILKSACALKSSVTDLCFKYNLIGWLSSKLRFNDANNDLAFRPVTFEILCLVAETLRNEETTLDAIRNSWLACFVQVLRFCLSEKRRKVATRSVDDALLIRAKKLARFISKKTVYSKKIKQLIAEYFCSDECTEE